MPLHINTPLIRSSALSKSLNKNVWLKIDALQPSGSFKMRGVALACETYLKQGAKRFISSSGGNAGLAVATSAKILNVPSIIVVPKTTSITAINLLQLEDAEVIVKGDSWQEANEYALSLITDSDAFIHPFDDPLLWTGHATLIDEIVNAEIQPDVIVLSVGGGGLLAGVAEGLTRNKLTHIPIIAIETEGTASLHLAIQHNKPTSLKEIRSIATSLGAKQICDQAFYVTKTHHIHSILVSDQEAIHACKAFLADHRIVVEPACGASLACIYNNKDILDPYNNILVIVCGGSTMSAEHILNL